jgi:23S rRNA G2445 N2-methylase RlmL
MVLPGLEPIAADEIASDIGGDIKRTGPGVVVFRVPEISPALLQLKTVEDVFLVGWGTDQLTYRAEDLERIRRWTAREMDWAALLRVHHAIRPKPKGKPTYRLVTQMSGTHGYRRIDAGKAVAAGMAGKLPASWRPAEEHAAVEIWLTIRGATAFCGIRLSDRTMRHRTYKMEHIAASLRPTLAAAMVRLAEVKPGQLLLDPMCGAGTILAEALEYGRRLHGGIRIAGGDLDQRALRAASANLRRLGQAMLTRWSAGRLPLPNSYVDRLVSNPPFGKQLGRPDRIGALYQRMCEEYDRVLEPRGKAVLLVSDVRALKQATQKVKWHLARQVPVRVLGQPAAVTVWRKQ